MLYLFAFFAALALLLFGLAGCVRVEVEHVERFTIDTRVKRADVLRDRDIRRDESLRPRERKGVQAP